MTLNIKMSVCAKACTQSLDMHGTEKHLKVPNGGYIQSNVPYI